MPEKFRPATAKSGGLGLIIAAVILLAVIAVSAGYFGYDYYVRSQIKPQPQPQPPVVELPAPPTEPAEETPLATTTLEMPTSTEPATPDITITPTSTAPTTGDNQIPVSLDSDSDGLTDVEETLLGTLPANADTDGDGYRDGVELMNGYDPAKPGNAKIFDSPFITSFVTQFAGDNFKIYYPKEWQVAQTKESKQALLTTDTGEVIKVTVRENQAKQTALAWYLENHPQTNVSSLRIVDYGNFSGIFSPDSQNAYLVATDKDKLYVFEYLAGRGSEFRYPDIFSFIVKFFNLAATPATDATSTDSVTITN